MYYCSIIITATTDVSDGLAQNSSIGSIKSSSVEEHGGSKFVVTLTKTSCHRQL